MADIICITPLGVPSKPYLGSTSFCTARVKACRLAMKRLDSRPCSFSAARSSRWNSSAEKPASRSSCSLVAVSIVSCGAPSSFLPRVRSSRRALRLSPSGRLAKLLPCRATSRNSLKRVSPRTAMASLLTSPRVASADTLMVRELSFSTCACRRTTSTRSCAASSLLAARSARLALLLSLRNLNSKRSSCQRASASGRAVRCPALRSSKEAKSAS
mmetsp:Transcript_111160/g.346447  ORF Transcript_111160/g.346447 Transcript_111160/m.346447 type:complete len:215 (-) Transcript_111160:193-837(-)